MTVEQLQGTIQEYLDGKMSPTEKADFDNQIKNSEPLAEEVRRFRQLSILNKNRSLIEANALLNEVMADIDIEPDYGKYEKHFKKSIWENPNWRWLLGSFAVLLVASSVFFYQKNQVAKAWANIAKTNLKPMENIIGFSPNTQTQDAKGMRAYDNENYAEAITLLNNASKNDPNDSSLRLYLAISYLMKDQNAKAEALLQELIKTNDLTTIPAKWYLALSLLQRGQKAEARILLQNLEVDTTYGDKAKAILKDL